MIKSSKIYFDLIFTKIFSILIMGLLLSFVACGDSVSVNNIIIPAELTGTWVTSGGTLEFTINGDGSGTYGGMEVSWEVEGNVLKLIIPGEETTTITWEIINGELILTNPSGPRETELTGIGPLTRDDDIDNDKVGSQGNGTADKPFLVRSDMELGYVGKGNPNPAEGYSGWTLDKHYKQVKDITLPAAGEGESNWTPIGNNSRNRFSGVYDGGRFKITGLTINEPSSDEQGMFNAIDAGSVVKNVGLEGCNIKVKEFVGGIAGYSYGTIQGCYTTGKVTGNNVNGGTGGIVGFQGNDAMVKNCYSVADVEGTGRVGGVVGENYSSNCKIQDCYSTGKITGDYAGGVAGTNRGTVERCYATGSVSGDSVIGGVVGYNNGMLQYSYFTADINGRERAGGVVGYNAGTVQYCFATSDVICTGDQNGGVVGANEFSGTVKDCYATGDVTGIRRIGGIVGTTNGGIVQNCYATGNATAIGESVGGIIGAFGGETVLNCVALSNTISANYDGFLSYSWIGRVVGQITTPSYTLNNNYGRDDMMIDVHSGLGQSPDSDDGNDVTEVAAKTQAWWMSPPTTGWDSSAPWDWVNIWNYPDGSGTLPTLKNMPGNPVQEPQMK